MPITTSEILTNEASRPGYNRIVFRHVDDLGVVYGPSVEHRPSGEDHAAWLTANAESLTASLVVAELEANTQEALGGE